MNLTSRLKPLVSRLRPRLGLSNDFRAAATKSWELGAATRSYSPPAIFDVENLGKITGVGSSVRTIKSEYLRARGGYVENAATIAYEIKDAIISRGQLFTWDAYLNVGTLPAPLLAPAALRHFEHAALASSWIGCRYFGHWLMDDLPRQLAAANIARPVSVLTDPTAGQIDYMRELGLELDTLSEASFDRIVVIEDFGQNHYKRERLDRLSNLARSRTSGKPQNKIMLLRGASGKRRLLINEAEVAAALERRGFAVIDPAKSSARKILQSCMDAQLVLGVEGSQLLNGVPWMAKGGAVVALQPPNRFELIIKDYCDCLDIRYAFVVGQAVEATTFAVDLAEVLRMIDRVELECGIG